MPLSKVGKRWRQSFYLFQNVLDRKKCRQMLAYSTLLRVSLRQIFSLASSLNVPKSIILMYKTFLTTETQAFLRSTHNWSTALCYFHFFARILRMQDTRLVVDLLHLNSHWWSPIIFSRCVVNLDSKIVYKILNVDEKSNTLYNYYNLLYLPSHKEVQWSTHSTAQANCKDK
jgi:hypothetical protein